MTPTLTCNKCLESLPADGEELPSTCAKCGGALAWTAIVAAELSAGGKPLPTTALLFAALEDGSEREVTEELFYELMEVLPPTHMRFPWGGKTWSFGFAEGAELVTAFRKEGARYFAQRTDLWPGDDPRSPVEPEPAPPQGVTRTWFDQGRQYSTPRRRALLLRQAGAIQWRSPNGFCPMSPALMLRGILERLEIDSRKVLCVGWEGNILGLDIEGICLDAGPGGRARIFYIDAGTAAVPLLVETTPDPPDLKGHQIRLRPVFDESDQAYPVAGWQGYAYESGTVLKGGVGGTEEEAHASVRALVCALAPEHDCEHP